MNLAATFAAELTEGKTVKTEYSYVCNRCGAEFKLKKFTNQIVALTRWNHNRGCKKRKTEPKEKNEDLSPHGGEHHIIDEEFEGIDY